MKGLVLLRKQRKLTQKQLGKLFGVELNTVWKWEKGLIAPSIDTIQKLAVFFNVSIDYLLNGPVKNEIEITVIIEETNNWELGVMDLTESSKDRFSVHIGPDKIGIEVIGRFEKSEDLDDVFARARKCAEETLMAQGRLQTI